MGEHRIRVAICGCGVAGLTLAITLHRYNAPGTNLQVDIYESDPEVRTAGAGITVWPRTWDVLKNLNMYDQLKEVAVQSRDTRPDTAFKPAFVARKANQPSDGFHFAHVLAPSGSTTMHRKDMLDVFLRNLPPSHTINLSKRLVGYEQRSDGSPGITLSFADGTTAEADVLLGADGVHSATRTCMYAILHGRDCAGSAASVADCPRCKASVPAWTGVCAYRNLIPTEKLYAMNPKHTTASVGAILCHIISYQVSGGKFLNFVAVFRVPGGEGTPFDGKWVAEVPKEDVLSAFDGWEPEVRQMLKCVENPTRWAVHVVDGLPSAVDGSVALVGDAMHAMPPNFGAGGGQAVEDAYILGRLLADPRVRRQHVPDLLRLYESVRLVFVNDISRRARAVGLMYEFNAPGFYDGTEGMEEEVEKTELEILGEEIHRMWQWQWREGLDSQWESAEAGLEIIVKSEE
ncbi:FAD/NAD-P-binding domain-containing protein [Epithele typhae]|uniref:FAD/NAD-P-binding domain-containing protein n=1 Tax=Epithele typhae TaxID=378194 RepID=UPI0020080A22|nr:FAD/NAD-P-binding domain-containing protein [Epithele typhae]KAH9945236.1 FAD/NAD-P-binding domain-containing protein [Epithele typhae]